MSLVSFVLGLSLGLSICFWNKYQFNHQLKKILKIFPQYEPVKTLSAISLIRRNIKIFKKEYERLLEEVEINEYLWDNSPICYLEIDQENQLIECNKKAREILKIENWKPQNPRLFLELIRCYELDQLIQQTRKTQQSLIIEWEFYPGNFIENESNNSIKNDHNYPIFLKASSYPLKYQQVGIFIENKQEIIDLSKSRERIFSDLSHELRTPLTSLSLLSETLLKKIDNQEKEWVEQMYKEINRLIDLVQNWLDISQIEGNPAQNLHYQTLDLKQLIISAWQSLEILAQEKELIFNYHGVENIYIEADINRLTQVFVNLFDNSIKHSYPQGKIEVNLRLNDQPANSIIIDIIDSGTGFAPSDLPHIFERLYRGDRSRVRSSQQGSGLGLAIVKEIIEAHNGNITAQNNEKNGGAFFQITLPTLFMS